MIQLQDTQSTSSQVNDNLNLSTLPIKNIKLRVKTLAGFEVDFGGALSVPL